MKVFISWSGEQSRQIALALHEWLPQALHAARPYMSEADNEAGSLWDRILSGELEESDFGIVCVTPSNLESRWINFEAGALSKAVSRARVVPLLFRLTNSDVGPPLSRFMMKPADKPGILDVLKAINANAESDRRLPDSHLLGTFESMWPKLEQELEEISRPKLLTKKPQRTDRQLLEEVLDLLRSNQRGGKSMDDESASLELIRRRIIYESIPPLRKIGGKEVAIEIKDNGKALDVLVLRPEDELSQMERDTIETIEGRLANYGITLQAPYIPF